MSKGIGDGVEMVDLQGEILQNLNIPRGIKIGTAIFIIILFTNN